MTLTRTEQDEQLVFTPQFGFRSAQILESPTNLVIERDGRTLTANLVSDRDCTTLHFTVLGFDAPADFDTVPYYHVKASATVRDDRGQEIPPHPRWHTGGMVHRRGDGRVFLDWQLKLVRLASDVRSVELSFGGPAGEWTVNIPIALTEPPGIPATPISVRDEHHGVVVMATAVARSSELTAIEIEADIVDEPGVATTSRVRYLQGIGANHQRGLANELLMLRDDQGHHHLERRVMSPPAPRQRQVASFPGLPSECVRGRSRFRSWSCSTGRKRCRVFRSQARPSCDSWGAKRRCRHRVPGITSRRFGRAGPTMRARGCASRSDRRMLKRRSSSCTSRCLKLMTHRRSARG